MNLVLNNVFVMNVATIQPRNGYNKYYFALEWIVHFSRPSEQGRGQAEAKFWHHR